MRASLQLEKSKYHIAVETLPDRAVIYAPSKVLQLTGADVLKLITVLNAAASYLNAEEKEDEDQG